ncbi:MAG: hypothetical protein ABIH23_06060 [bacterium]
MTFRCLIDCLVQKAGQEKDQFGNPNMLINLRAKANETYNSPYDLTEYNPPGEMPLFERIDGGPPVNTPSRLYVSQPSVPEPDLEPVAAAPQRAPIKRSPAKRPIR